jgi:mannitol-1-phosphate 5-dehydrogenase
MLKGDRTYVGFGFGAIQAGLFLYEAFHSGGFSRLVVAEIDPEIVDSLRAGGNHFMLNIAHSDRIESVRIGPVEVYNPADAPDRTFLTAAVAAAAEIGTAIPSVGGYDRGEEGSIRQVLADGLRMKAACGGPPCIVYAAENHNRAAEILEARVREVVPPDSDDDVFRNVCFLNTVIGKMSGLITVPMEMCELNLSPVTPGEERAFLVEAFNRILISRVPTDREIRFQRGICTFIEKNDLLPFEEAKLYGHNATHALAGYIGAMLGTEQVSDLRSRPGILSFLSDAFIRESGEALIRKHGGIDPLFTPEGYRRYAEDLLERMFNPFLHDRIERVIRDTPRKLGWDDRLIGTIRLAMSQGIEPDRYAFGAAAALVHLTPSLLSGKLTSAAMLKGVWMESGGEAAEQSSVIERIDLALIRLNEWRKLHFPDLHEFFEMAPNRTNR